MTKLQRIQETVVKKKAAVMLNLKPSQICKVNEHSNGATVHCKNGNILQIPLTQWIGIDPSEVEALNKTIEREKWIYGRFQVVDDENVAHENIPCKTLWVDRRYEIVTYPAGGKGVQFLGREVQTILLAKPETDEGWRQAQELNFHIEA